MSHLPILQPRLVMGLNTDVEGNVQFITDDDIIYPVGSVLVLHNIHQKKQKYIRLADRGKNVTSIHVSPNKKLVAVIEKGARPLATLYDPGTYKKKRQLNIPSDIDVQATNFVCCAFTFDSKYLICVSGDPDWELYCFKCDKGRLESTARANNANGTGIVKQIATNTNDANQICLVGENLARFMGCADYVWRQFGYNKSDQIHLTSAVWLSQDRLLAGSIDGKLFIFETGELRAIFSVADLPVMNLKFQDEIPDHTIEREYDDSEPEILNVVNCLSISPAQDRLLVSCKEKQLYSVRLWLQDLNANPEVMFTEYGPFLHHGPIGSMSVCSWKPIVLTAGQIDRTLMIWNYENEEMELRQKFQDDVNAVALHPTGLYCTVGFSDKLRFITIMIDEFMTTREFPIRSCKFCSFSRMGQFFAAANGNVIQVYSTINFDLVYVLKGHNGRITGMSWAIDDLKMASCGTEGAVYEWYIPEAKRVSETVIKSCPFNGVVMTGDGKSTFAVGDDGHIRELMNSNVHRDVILTNAPMDDIVLSKIDQMLFVAGHHGVIYSVKLPILEKADYMDYIVHGCAIQTMLISYDDRYLISGGKDGTLCFWKLLNTEGKAIKMDKDFKPSEEILIARLILEDKLTQIRDLKLRMHELETEHAYQLRQNDVIHTLRMKDIHAGYCSAIEELKEKNESMEADHIQEINNINLDIAKMKAGHEQFVQKLEANYNEKLIFEYEKYRRLEEKMEKMRRGYEKELEDLRQAKLQSENSITNSFLEKLHEQQVLFDELMEKSAQKAKEHEMIKQQIEDDADREIYEIKSSFQKELKDEQDMNVKLRSEVTLIKKKLMTSQKEIEDFRHKCYNLESELTKLKAVIINLEKDIADLRKEILERDATIQDKEKRIFELKSKNQELEKFKFILDFKIKELKSQIEPRERTIKEQIEQINEMVNELESLQKVILNLDLQLSELREKLNASEHEVRKEVAKNRRMKDVLKTIRTDIHHASGYIQNIPMLTKTVKEMYHKYNADKDFALSHTEDVEAKSEFLRQRQFLERTVATLQQQASKSSSSMGYDKIRLVEENSDLLLETNNLRKDVKAEQRQNQKLQSILGFSRRYIPPRVAEEKLNRAIATRQQIRDEYAKELEEKNVAIEAMQDENCRLTNKIVEEFIVEDSDEQLETVAPQQPPPQDEF